MDASMAIFLVITMLLTIGFLNLYFGWREDLKGLEKVQDVLRSNTLKSALVIFVGGHNDGYLKISEKTIPFSSWRALNIVVALLEQSGVIVNQVHLVHGGT